MPQSIPSQRILVIDDEWSVRNTLRLALTFERNSVELATDAREALQKLAKQKFDIVFTDLMMPQMLGYDLVRCIRNKYPYQVIVMVTAYPDFLGPREKKENPVDIIIIKPFSLATITNALERAYEMSKDRKTTQASLPPPSTPP